MADTGNPWFIPFAEPSDLVRDWPALSSAVGTAVAAGLTAAGNAGIGSNVVQAVKLDTFSTTSTSYVDVTDLAVTITPSSDTVKILLLAHVATGNSSAVFAGTIVQIVGGNAGTFIGNASASLPRGAMGVVTSNEAHATRNQHENAIIYLDSPATAAAVTYKVQIRTGGGGTSYVNRQGDDLSRVASSLVAIEVAV
jgi:hypothetical protein